MSKSSVLAIALAALGLFACGDSSAPSGNNHGDAGAVTSNGLPEQSTGAQLFSKYACASCHQSSDGAMSGADTPIAKTTIYAANITPDKDTGIGAWSDAQITEAVRGGVDNGGQPLCSIMPRFAAMTDAEAAALVMYMRGLRPAHKSPPSTSQCPDAQGASADAGVAPDAGGGE